MSENKSKGIFDQEPNKGSHQEPRKGPLREPSIEELQPGVETTKKQFKDPFSQHAEQISERSSKKPNLDQIIGKSDSTLDKTAAAVNSSGPGSNVQADLDEMDNFSEEDIGLAEKMIFKGYAEFDSSMKIFPDNKFTICSTSAEEISLIEEIIFDYIKSEENEDGIVDIPQSNVQALKSALFVAISYRGMNQQELMDDTSCYLNAIKKSIIRITELHDSGKLDEAVKLKKITKECLLKRASKVKRLATPLIDFLSDAKHRFDSKMLAIMNSKGLVPKS